MISLPALPYANDVKPSYVDTGILQRSGVGATIDKIVRPGSHMAATFSYPPMVPDDAEVFLSRLMQAKDYGVIVEWPLLGRDQSGAGAVVVDGVTGTSAGTSLYVRGAASGFVFKEGFWINVFDASSRPYLHKVTADAAVSGGKALLGVRPPLRAVLADGYAIAVTAPVIAGTITSDLPWSIPVEGLPSLSFTVEESR